MGPTVPYLLTVGPPLLKPFLQGSRPTIGVVVSAMFFGAIVWSLYDAAPKVASAFTWVAASTSILTNGSEVIQLLNTKGDKK